MIDIEKTFRNDVGKEIDKVAFGFVFLLCFLAMAFITILKPDDNVNYIRLTTDEWVCTDSEILHMPGKYLMATVVCHQYTYIEK
jgi:hypothetical protein